LHDIADGPLSLTRFILETNYKKTSAVMFAITMVIWAYTRLFVLPIYIYETIFYLPQFKNWHYIVKPMFVFLMSALCMLHFYWFKLFIGILTKYTRDGKTDDTVGGVEVRKKEKNA